MKVNTPYEIIEKLVKELDKLKLDQENILIQTEKAIGICSLALIDLRKCVISNGFKNKKEEIYFFKHIKPKAYFRFLFYTKFFKIECKRPQTTITAQLNYLINEIEELENYFIDNSVFYKYYRLKSTHMDEKYYLRNCEVIPKSFNDLHFLIDKDFSTCHDQTLATIIAHEELIEYLKSQIQELEYLKVKQITEKPIQKEIPQLNWTGSKASLVELIYALHGAGVINMGQVDIKDLAILSERILNIELGDFYRTFIEVRSRKIERTKFLDNLKESLLKRMNDADK